MIIWPAFIFYANSLLGRLGTTLLLGNGVPQCITFLLHFVSTIGSSSSSNHIPTAREHWNHSQQHSQADYSCCFHCNSSNQGGNTMRFFEINLPCITEYCQLCHLEACIFVSNKPRDNPTSLVSVKNRIIHELSQRILNIVQNGRATRGSSRFR